MDERHTKITEGAGLEESKLNTEFIGWLQKWSTPILLVVLLVVVGWVAYRKWEEAKAAKQDLAFEELSAVLSSTNVNPVSLAGIAQTYEGVKAVSPLARLAAADRYLALVRQGVAAGANVKPDGTVESTDALTDEQRARNLGEAEQLYQLVLNDESRAGGRPLLAMGAAYGLAAVAEARGELDKARSWYEKAIEIAKRSGFEGQEKLAQQRIASLDEIATMPKLYAKAELPQPPAPVTPDPGATGATGTPGELPPLPTLPTLEIPPSPGEPGATGPTGTPAGTGDPEPAPTGSPAPTAPAAPPSAPTGEPTTPAPAPK